ncbi:hypothetical protein J2046_004325 [Rhizobium petrolearium]|uniref:hypothetical protein n=1 Tax=Neorhizobium petrolearium TaxID=515361 RepID=UPI001F16FA04|nr:hypothetical protein [Neorhizobium petrolearium]MBP1846051.1 hypothetical protein [Neorhizobium petrolearium]
MTVDFPSANDIFFAVASLLRPSASAAFAFSPLGRRDGVRQKSAKASFAEVSGKGLPREESVKRMTFSAKFGIVRKSHNVQC